MFKIGDRVKAVNVADETTNAHTLPYTSTGVLIGGRWAREADGFLGFRMDGYDYGGKQKIVTLVTAPPLASALVVAGGLYCLYPKAIGETISE